MPPPKVTKESIQEAARASKMSVRDYIGRLPDSFLTEAARASKMDVSQYRGRLADSWGEPVVADTIPEKKNETSNDSVPPLPGGTEPASPSALPSQSGVPFGVEAKAIQTENPLIPKEFQQPPRQLTPIQIATQRAVQEAKAVENDIRSFVINPNDAGIIIDTYKPATSKYNNAIIELNKATGLASDALTKPENYANIIKKIRGDYDKAISDQQDYTYDRFGEKRAGTGRDNDRTLSLKRQRDILLKNASLLRDISAFNSNPNATADQTGGVVIESDNPVLASKLKAVPDLVSGNYYRRQLGIGAQLNGLAIKFENGKQTEEDVAKVGDLLRQQENIVYDFPEVRKGQLREVVMERLSQGKKLGGVLDGKLLKDAMGEIDKMIASPINSKDVPLLKQMKEDLDFGYGKNIMSSDFVGVPNAEAKYQKFLKERESYQGQGFLENFGRGFGETFNETAKWLEGKIGTRTDVTRIKEEDEEEVGAKKYTPKKFQLKVPQYTRSITTGELEENPDAGDYQLRNIPYKAASGMGQLAAQVTIGEFTAGVVSPALRSFSAIGEGIGGLGMAANAGRNFGANVAKTVGNGLKVMAPAYAMSYDQNRKEALQMFGTNPENGWKVDTYSNAASLLEGATEIIGNPYEQFDMVKSAFKRAVKDQLSKELSKLSLRELEKMSRPQWQKTFETVGRTALKAVAKGVKNVSGEAAEEWVNAFGSYGAASLLGADMAGRDALGEANDAFIEAAASMSFLGAVGMVNSVNNYYSNSGLSKQSVYDVATRPDVFRDKAKSLHADGVLTEEELNEKLNLINSAQAAKKNWDGIKQFAPQSTDVTQRNKLAINFVQARTNELALQKEHDKIGVGEAVKKKLAQQIGKWQKVQEALIGPKIDFNTDGQPVLPAISTPDMVEVRAESIEDVPEEFQESASPTVNERGEQEVVFFVPNKDAIVIELSPTVPENEEERQKNLRDIQSQLAAAAAIRDQKNNEITEVYQDNMTDPDAWVKPYEDARKEQEQMIASLETGQSADMQREVAVRVEVKNIANMRNDDFMREYFDEADMQAYEAADDATKQQLIRDKKQEIINQKEGGQNGQENIAGLSSEVGKREEPVQAEYDQEGGGETVTASGILQAQGQEKVMPVKQPQEGDKVTIAPAVKGGMQRNMIFEDGTWKQQIGGKNYALKGNAQELANTEWEKANKPKDKPKAETKEVAKDGKTTVQPTPDATEDTRTTGTQQASKGELKPTVSEADQSPDDIEANSKHIGIVNGKEASINVGNIISEGKYKGNANVNVTYKDGSGGFGGNMTVAEIKKAKSLKQKETVSDGKKQQAISSGEDWSKDVESTAKALEGKGVNEKILTGTEVSDNNGKPLKVYHGTNVDFENFKKTKSNRHILTSLHEVETEAFFFHPKKEFAQGFGDKIKEAFLNIKKLANNHQQDLIDAIKETWVNEGSVETANNGNIYFDDYPNDSWIEKMADKDGIDWMLLENKDFINNLKKRGIDGTGVWEDDNSISYAVFDSKNIIQDKSPKQLSEAYHKAKADGSNPELVKAVEEILTQKPNEQSTTPKVSEPIQSNTTEPQGQGTEKATQQSAARVGQADATGTTTVPIKNVSLTPQIKQDADNIIAGKAVFERFSPEEQRGFAEGGRSHVEVSIILSGENSPSESAANANEAQEESIEKYAKENGIWYDNPTEQLTEKYGEPIASGEEAIVWDNGDKVVKSQNTLMYGDLQEKLDGITLHNSYFPEAAVRVIGFGRNIEGDFQIIVEQPFVVGADTKVSREQIREYLNRLGFNETDEGHFSNGDTIIEDVHTGNAILTPKGNIVVIDPIMRLNTPEQGYGGTRTISDKISSNEKANEPTNTGESAIARKTSVAAEKTGDAKGTAAETGKTATEKAKELADRIRLLRPRSGSAQSNFLAIPLALYDTAIVAVANAVEAGGALVDAIQAGIDVIRNGMGKDYTDKMGKSFADRVNKHLAGEQVGDDIVLGENKESKTKNDVIEELLSIPIDKKSFPTLFSSSQNVELKQETAKTQGDKQGRLVDGVYVKALLSDMRGASFQVAKQLESALGENWMRDVVAYLERYPKRGDVAQITGILNLISTDTFNKINNANKATEMAELRNFQNRIDTLANIVSRGASLALNQRRIYGELAKGKSIAEIMAAQVLTQSQQDFVKDAQDVLAAKVTDDEVNSVPDTPAPKKNKRGRKRTQSEAKNERREKSAKRQNKTPRKQSKEQADDIIQKGATAAQRTDEDGNKRRLSFKELAKIARDKVNKIKCN